MSRFFSILLFVPLYFMCIFMLIYVSIIQNEIKDFEEYKLAISLDYSVDAASEEMLGLTDLGMDYIDKNKMYTDPDLALDTFVDVFALNYDLPLIKPTRDLIKEKYIQMFTVTSYDGFYVYQMERVNEEGDWHLVASPKIPYSYRDGDFYYALNLGLENCIRMYNGKLTKEPIPVSKTEVMKVINSRVSDELMDRMDRLYDHGSDKTVHIPYGMTTIKSVNPIKGPSVLAFIDNMDFGSHTIGAFSVGGSRVENARMVASYTRNGIDYYSYADLLPEEYATPGYIQNLYTSAQEAAQAGYHHDSLYMDK